MQAVATGTDWIEGEMKIGTNVVSTTEEVMARSSVVLMPVPRRLEVTAVLVASVPLWYWRYRYLLWWAWLPAWASVARAASGSRRVLNETIMNNQVYWCWAFEEIRLGAYVFSIEKSRRKWNLMQSMHWGPQNERMTMVLARGKRTWMKMSD